MLDEHSLPDIVSDSLYRAWHRTQHTPTPVPSPIGCVLGLGGHATQDASSRRAQVDGLEVCAGRRGNNIQTFEVLIC
jgi:hypothetical protein